MNREAESETPLAFLTLAVLIGAAFSLPAHAQQPCGERQKAIDYLADKHNETPTEMGLASNGSVLEVISSESGSWTIIVTRPDGVSCMIASGQSWERLEPVILGSDS